MTTEEKLAMYELALKDIQRIKGLVDGDWADMVGAARSIATDALSGVYKGWRADEDF